MKQKLTIAILLVATAIAVLAQNYFTDKLPGASTLTDQQRIERLEKQVLSIQSKLATLEQQSRTQIRPLGNSK